MEVLQVLFDPCNEMNAFGGPEVIFHHSGPTRHLAQLFLEDTDERRGGDFSRPCHPSQTTGPDPGHSDQGCPMVSLACFSPRRM